MERQPKRLFRSGGSRMGYINAQQIPKSEGNMIGSLLFTTISEYFADPQHQQDFEEWKRSRADKPKREKVIPLKK